MSELAAPIGDGSGAGKHRSVGRAIAREPLVHFVLVAVLVVAARCWLRDGALPADARRAPIVLTQADVDARIAREQAASGKPVSPARRTALVEQLVRDEVLHREALALGLDQSDEIVRRRLVQMMELLLATAAPDDPPSDAELVEYVAAHREKFERPARVALTHVFVGRAAHPEDGEPLARELLARLAAGADSRGLGDPFPRGTAFPPRTVSELDASFGPLFGERVIELPVGRWSGPIASSYGLHLVRIDQRIEPAVPPLDEIRAEARKALSETRRESAARMAYRKIEKRYRIERPAGIASEAGASE
ncbi:MAG: peptidylprolyl isomerase [bacterium]